MKDLLLKTENNIEYFLISQDSDWWEKLVENGYKSNHDFVPPLTERMPMEAIFNRFKNENAFTIVGVSCNSFAGCFCCYLKHPISRKSVVQFILIEERFRDKKLTNVFFEIAFETFMNHGRFLIETITWSTNYRSQRVFTKCGFYLKNILENTRGEGVHTLIYEKSILRSGYFTDFTSVGVVYRENCSMVSKYVDEIKLLMLQIGETIGQPNVEVLNTAIQHIPITNASCNLNPNDFNKNASEPVEYPFQGKPIELIDYITELVKLKQGKYLMLCSASSILAKQVASDNILFPDTETQGVIDVLIYNILYGEMIGNAVKELSSIIASHSISGVIIACIEFSPISDEIEKLLVDIEIVNVFQILKYDIVDSWREGRIEAGSVGNIKTHLGIHDVTLTF